MVWLGVCTKGVLRVAFLEKGSVTQEQYATEVLPVASRFGIKHFGNDWTFQQDGATAHTAKRTQRWCEDNLPRFIRKERWRPNGPDLNPLHSSVWNEIVQGIKWNKVTSKVKIRS